MAVVFAAASPHLVFRRHSFCSSAKKELGFAPQIVYRRWVVCDTRLTHPRPASPRAARSTTAELNKEEAKDEKDEAEAVEESVDLSQFIEVGVVISKHGVKGEVLVRSSTDFPEERFEKPGTRWLKMSRRGKQRIESIELVKGRIRVGKLPCWLLTFKDVNSPEQAADYVGATMLVKRDERPPLEEGEFYIPDLIGMDVVLQSSGEIIGVIVDMCNFGASDLLRVQRIPTSSVGDGPLMWIPFVEAIVPEVLMDQRKVIVNPPPGLLELNTRAKKDVKSEARKEELRSKRKLQLRKSGLKKSLLKTNQEHLLAGLSLGEKDEQDMLLSELLEIDFKALNASFERGRNKREYRLGKFAKLPDSKHSAGKDWLNQNISRDDQTDEQKKWWKQGLELMIDSKVAVASLISSVADDPAQSLDVESRLRILAERLSAAEKLASVEFLEEVCQIPWFICTSSDFVETVQSLLDENQFFGLKQTQVCVIAQESNPCFDINPVGGNHRILQTSPWKIAKALSGDGGVLKALSTEGLVAEFAENGIQYLQVIDGDNTKTRIGDPIFFGFTQARKSDMSIQVAKLNQPGDQAIGFTAQTQDDEDEDKEKTKNFELVYRRSSSPEDEELLNAVRPLRSCVLSVAFAKGLQEKGFEYELQADLARVSYYKEEDGKCEQVIKPEEPNSFQLKYSVLDCASKCEAKKLSLLEVED